MGVVGFCALKDELLDDGDERPLPPLTITSDSRLSQNSANFIRISVLESIANVSVLCHLSPAI